MRKKVYFDTIYLLTPCVIDCLKTTMNYYISLRDCCKWKLVKLFEKTYEVF